MMEEDVPIEHRWTTRAVETAQKKVEAHNFDIRKHLLEYDDVMNQQRKVVYGMRKEVLSGQELKGRALGMFDQISENIAHEFFPSRKSARGSDSWDLEGLNQAASLTFSTPVVIHADDLPKLHNEAELAKAILTQVDAAYSAKEAGLGEHIMRDLEKMIILSTIDQLWKDHLLAMDHLREGINLRGYGQKDPLMEYKKEGYKLFEIMFGQISYEVARKLFEVQVQREEQIEEMAPKPPAHITFSGGGESAQPAQSAAERTEDGDKVGRNDPCPCGSGKKYKKCHGT